MNKILSSWVVGYIFAIGLGISGMTQPQKVIGFLDFFGNWDPSLVFVMLGSIVVHFVTYKIIRKRSSPLFSTEWHVPTKTKITNSLVIGSIMFGVGWGLAGFCPGPALVNVTSGQTSPLIFILGLVAGMYIFKVVDKKFKFNR